MVGGTTNNIMESLDDLRYYHIDSVLFASLEIPRLVVNINISVQSVEN